MDRLRTVFTFLAGVIVGGGAIYLSPAQQPGMDPGMPQGLLPPVLVPGGPPLGAPLGDPGQAPEIGGVPAPGGIPAEMPDGRPGTSPQGLAPADAAQGVPEGPPLAEGGSVPDAPANRPSQGGSRLERHLRAAPEAWAGVLVQVEASPAATRLVSDVKAHIATLPAVGDTMPPLQEVATYLANSRLLLDRIGGAGIDVSAYAVQIDTLLRPPKGRLPAPGQPGAPAGLAPGSVPAATR